MEVKELQSQLILGKVTVSQALQLALVYYADCLSEKSKFWISSELNGYDNSMAVPGYRQVDCDLKLEVYNAFGGLQIQTLDTSHINSFLEEGGVEKSSPNKMRISQNLESIEKTQHDEMGTMSMTLTDNMKDMVLEWYLYPAYASFGKLYQECPSAYINVLLAKVKNLLIEILQHEVLPVKSAPAFSANQLGRKKVFISYSWENEEHKTWVHKLAERLSKEFDVLIDVKQPFGTDINVFMERMVAEADRVLLILTPAYKQKADNRENGVGYESVLISDELYTNQDSVKLVPIIRRGTKEGSFPRYLGNRKGLIMTTDKEFDDNLKLLVEDLKSN